MSARPLLCLLALSSCLCAEPVPESSLEGPYLVRSTCPVPVPSDENWGPYFERVYDASMKALEAEQADEALACAQRLSRLLPEEPLGHLARARAYEGLGRFAEAHHAFSRALALAPDEPEVLLEVADFFVNEGGEDALETALLLARRGRENTGDQSLAAALALVEAVGANTLGYSSQALSAAETALALDDLEEAHVERGIALFELTRLDEAERVFENARLLRPTDARLLYWSGLLSEHRGRSDEARTLLAKAAALDPELYPLPLELSVEEFEKIVEAAVASLLPTDRQRLDTEARLSRAELPELEDLRDGDTVLSPTILGLYRPNENEARSDIILYRKNILRFVRNREELRREVLDTLLHELGHLAGEDDDSLRDRGL